MQQLAKIETPAFVAVVGKPNLYQTPDGAYLVSVRVESITVVDRETRDLWVLDAARSTLDRIDSCAAGTDPDTLRIKEHYPSLEPETFRKMAYEALAQVKI
jgi:RPA family protein